MRKIFITLATTVLLAASCSQNNSSSPQANSTTPQQQVSTTSPVANNQTSEPQPAKNVCLNRYLKYQLVIPKGWSAIQYGIMPEKLDCEKISQKQQEFDAKLPPDSTIGERGFDPVSFYPDDISVDKSSFTIGVCDSRCIGYPNKPVPSTNLKENLKNNQEIITSETTLNGQQAYWTKNFQGKTSISANYKGSMYQIQFSKDFSEDIKMQVVNGFKFLP